ncbi:DNA glycosylase [Xylariaceae sp. FL0594]|nr:DNA glycosylase [Xylariaceae sp. FL0594]
MSEESDEQAAEPPSNSSRPQEPTFQGRLQLNEFMFQGATTSHSTVITRRSARLLLSSQSASVSASGDSPTPTPTSGDTSSLGTTSSPTRRRRKRNSTPGDDGEEASSSSSPSKRKKRPSSSYAPPSTYAHLSPLIDILAPNLLILFVGLNPGVQTARSGHAYAHPSNLFWKLLYSSGLTPTLCKPAEDRSLPARFSLGNTNIVARPSRNGAELSRAEMDDGVAVLERKVRDCRPEVVCLVGKSIFESVFRVVKGRSLKKDEFEYGWQDGWRMGAIPPLPEKETAVVVSAGEEEARVQGEREEGESVDNTPWEGAKIFVATSTSGLAASVRPEEKERIWKILGDWCVQRRKERAAAAAEEEEAAAAGET